MTAEGPGNVASRLAKMASMTPGAIAIAEPDGRPKKTGPRSYSVTTFRELDRRSDAIAKGLLQWGVRPGMRLAMLVPFGAEFVVLTFALLKAGVVVVLIDPGMGREHLLRCLDEAEPDGFVGIGRAQAVRWLLRGRFRRARWNVTVGSPWWLGGKRLAAVEAAGGIDNARSLPKVRGEDDAAIIFTTGSTGPPKGVLYSHNTFHAQIDRIRDHYGVQPGSRDLACFPLFALFDAVMGVTTIIPDMDPTRPAAVNPRRLIEAAEQWEVDQAFGSPALWGTVVRWCGDRPLGRPFPTLRRVLSAGAPVPAETLTRLRRLVHPEAEIVTPYGATEALPIASIESRAIIAETGPASAKGKGVCVGERFPDVRWRVIEITDGPLSTIDQTRELPHGKIGELMVSGPMVTTRYAVRGDQDALHKVRDRDSVWHRMGDVGYLDKQDRFWFCGRKAHRVQMGKRTLFTIPCEAVFNNHPDVFRSALVGLGEAPDQKPVIVVEPHADRRPQTDKESRKLTDELLNLASRNPITRRIDRIVTWPEPLPVDIRHNSKIFREQLAARLNRNELKGH